jgi:hypothetical protein
VKLDASHPRLAPLEFTSWEAYCAAEFGIHRAPVRVVDSSSGSESRVVPALTIKTTEAWLVPVDGSAARPSGAGRLRYLRTSNLDARISRLAFCNWAIYGHAFRTHGTPPSPHPGHGQP